MIPTGITVGKKNTFIGNAPRSTPFEYPSTAQPINESETTESSFTAGEVRIVIRPKGPPAKPGGK
jgi:hypothetical protein